MNPKLGSVDQCTRELLCRIPLRNYGKCGHSDLEISQIREMIIFVVQVRTMMMKHFAKYLDDGVLDEISTTIEYHLIRDSCSECIVAEICVWNDNWSSDVVHRSHFMLILGVDTKPVCVCSMPKEYNSLNELFHLVDEVPPGTWTYILKKFLQSKSRSPIIEQIVYHA